MRRRFIDREIWQEDWFVALNCKKKALWFYLWSIADEAGTFSFPGRLGSVTVGEPVSEADLDDFGQEITKLTNGRFLIRSLIPVEYGELKRTVRQHTRALALVAEMGIPLNPLTTCSEPVPNPKDRTGQDKTGQDRNSGESENTVYSPHSRAALHYLNEQSGRAFRETATNLSFIDGRLKEPGVTIDGVKAMIDRQCSRWLGTEQAEFLRPETLFNKTKFDSYYAARDIPVVNGARPKVAIPNI